MTDGDILVVVFLCIHTYLIWRIASWLKRIAETLEKRDDEMSIMK